MGILVLLNVESMLEPAWIRAAWLSVDERLGW